MAQNRFGQGKHVIDRRRVAAVHQGTRPCCQHKRLAGPWSRTPSYVLPDLLHGGFIGPSSPNKVQYGLYDTVANRNLAHQALRSNQIIRGQYLFRGGFTHAGRFQQDLTFGFFRWIGDVYLHQEAVELCFRQRVGSLLFQRILCCQNVKRVGQGMVVPGDRDTVFLHGLQQRRLGARARPVYFIGHQKLTKNRSMNETEGSCRTAAFALVQDFRPENISRHQVGRKLHAFVIQPHDRAKCFHQLGFSKSRHAYQENVTPCQERDKSFIDDLSLAEYDAPDMVADERHPLTQGLNFSDEPGRRCVTYRNGCCGGLNGSICIGHAVLHVVGHQSGRRTVNNSILNGLEGKHPQNTVGAASGDLPFCGDIDMRITRDGVWHYRGSPINRLPMVKLFASVLKRDEAGDFWLETPVEKCRIQVDDAPFLAVDMSASGSGRDQTIIFRTNLDENVTVGPEHPIRIVHDSQTGNPFPYVLVRGGLEALISRAVYYDLVELAVEEDRDGQTHLFVWSGGVPFELGVVDGN